MNIVIIGAGDIGLHLASIFSSVGYGIVLIDKEPLKLEIAARDLDIVTRISSGTDWQLLEELLEFTPDLLIAVTNDDEINLVACTIAKHLGYPRTIARVRNPKYFMQGRLPFEQLFAVDYMISPEKLTADSIGNMILFPGSIAIENFSHGAVQMRTVTIPLNWKKRDIPLSKRQMLELPSETMVALIRRKEEIIFPHGQDTLLPGDEVTFIGETNSMLTLPKFLNIAFNPPKTAVIIGGSLIGINLAKNLQARGMEVLMVEKEEKKCHLLSTELPHCRIIHHDGTDYRFLQSMRLCSADVFVACTRRDETNFLSALAAKDLKAEHVIISLSDVNYFPLVNHLGITHTASPRAHAANRIFTIAREKTVASMVSMHDARAEVMEVKVSNDSKIAGIPIKHLSSELPKDFLITIIQNRGRIFIADGNRILSPGDTVIVITTPKHMKDIVKLF